MLYRGGDVFKSQTEIGVSDGEDAIKTKRKPRLLGYRAARALVARDYNMPRVLLLWLLSGAAFADRSEWGGDSLDVLVRRNPWFGIFHE